MEPARKTWLVVNPDSGSYDEASFEALTRCFAEQGIVIERVVHFPDDDLPTAADLDAAGIDMVTIYTGDGTINALVTGLYGWGGSVLILPGGTMNLLPHRLHGEVEAEAIVARVAAGRYERCRPHVIRCEAGDALAGLLAGPGTAWNEVREAMRHFDIVGIAEGAAEAIGESTAGPTVRLVDPAIGLADGYPLVLMSPGGETMRIAGYHSETVGDYAQQGVALLKRDFREGPHDELGRYDTMTMTSADGGGIDVLIDGEPASLPSQVTFRVVPCEVDLLASGAGYVWGTVSADA